MKLTYVLMVMFAVDAWNLLALLMKGLRVAERKVLGRRGIATLMVGQRA